MDNTKEVPDESDRQFEIYRLMVETWRWQIDSNWHRTDYFHAFQTVLLLAAGKVILDRHFCAGLAVSAFGLALNIGWILNDWKAGAYTDYWRKAAESVEAGLAGQFLSACDKKAEEWHVRRACPKYGHLMWYVRLLFTGAWIGLIGFIALRACVTAILLGCQH